MVNKLQGILILWLACFCQQARALPEATALTIFNRLNGVFCERREAPTLIFTQQLSDVFYQPSQNRVVVGRSFLTFLDRFGPDANATLALVLAHELSHHYAQHGLQKVAGDEIATVKHLEEIEADYAAIVYAHLAGYSTANIEAPLLNELYETLDLSENGNSHYLKKAERLEVFQKARAELSSLLTLFDAGKLLLIIGENTSAANCFVTIGNRFPSPEIYIDTGIAYARAALALADSRTKALIFPFTFNENSGIAAPSDIPRNVRSAEDASQRVNYLISAKNNFEMALACRNDDHEAMANLLAVYFLMGQEHPEQRSIYQLKMDYLISLTEALSVQKQGFKRDLKSFYQAAGSFINAPWDDAASKDIFQRLGQAGDPVAQLIFERINQGNSPEHKTSNPCIGREKIRGLTPKDRDDCKKINKQLDNAIPFLLRGADFESVLKIAATTEQEFILSLHQTIMNDHGALNSWKNIYTYALSSGLMPHGRTCGGLKPGDDFIAMRNIYGLPSDVLESSSRMYCLYPANGLVIVLESDKVVEWMVFNSIED